MTVHTPMFYGLIVRKSNKTAEYVARCNTTHRDRYPDMPHNEDEHLMAVSIAMSGDDLDYVISRFEAQGWVRGVDFVATMSEDGLLEPLPKWLEEFEFTPNPASKEPHPMMRMSPHKAYRMA
jgi:hypothetical protein